MSRDCDNCYVGFTPDVRRPDQQFCSAECRQSWTNRYRRVRVQVARLEALLPRMAGAEREVWERYGRLLRLSLAAADRKKVGRGAAPYSRRGIDR
ncbi:hypothetical protein [Streptomyces noursei]|uniref:hypothetical protein n=1 Tax=Streptomyces noursei TaxID=1971 RepID=UPI0035DFA5A1